MDISTMLYHARLQQEEQELNYFMFMQAQQRAEIMKQRLGAYLCVPTALPPTATPTPSKLRVLNPNVKVFNPNAKCFTCKGTREVDSPFNPEETVPCSACK
jgi:hypothetical protein